MQYIHVFIYREFKISEQRSKPESVRISDITIIRKQLDYTIINTRINEDILYPNHEPGFFSESVMASRSHPLPR